MENITFTVVNGEDEQPINISYDDIGGYEKIPALPVVVSIGTLQFEVHPQQLMELGTLFIALAGVEGIDFDSADALLEGFSLKGKEAVIRLSAALEE